MSWRNLIWMSIILCLAGLAFYLSRGKPERVQPNDPALEDLAGAVRVYKLIQENSYHELSAGKACRGAIEGMVHQVDKFSVYIPPGKVAPFSRRVAGTLEETGLRISCSAGRLVVVGPLPGSPAHKAGLFEGLEILAVDETPAADLTVEQARKMVATPVEGVVTLHVRGRDGGEFERELKSARFHAETVTGIARDEAGEWVYALDEGEGIFYLRISEFVRRTPGELQDVYRGLDDPRGLVLDLRDNPGGTLPAAAEVADRFVAEGVIVRTVPRHGKEQVHRAHAAGTYPEVPLVVLIDGSTASAAEIVAGALQVHGRAMLLGEQSFGKWCVQTLFPLGPGLGKAYFTTAEYFLAEPEPTTQPTQPASAELPDGEGERPGLQPDLRIAVPAAAAEELELLRLQAAVAWAPEDSETKPVPPTRPSRSKSLMRSILKLDAQLARALEELREGRVPTTRPAGSGKRSRARP